MQNNLSFTAEDLGKEDAFAYLGIELQFDGPKVTMTQDRLIKKIFRMNGYKELNRAKSPANERPLGANIYGELFNEEWEYASIVGMLMFLVNTRPEIQFAVHQCACFNHNPKARYAKAVKRILRYLKRTLKEGKDRGLTLNIENREDKLQIDCYVDADFAGL